LPTRRLVIFTWMMRGGAQAGPAQEAEKPIAFYLASAAVEKGEAQFKKCAGCHTINKGGPAGSGPNLGGIMGNNHAHQAGFAYSDAIKSKPGPWDWDAMSEWLKSPKTYAPGTKMSFAGISKPQDRAALLVYLNAQGDKQLPLPPVPAEEPAAAPAEAPAADAPTTAAAPAEAAAAPKA
jgi:cytochrome c